MGIFKRLTLLHSFFFAKREREWWGRWVGERERDIWANLARVHATYLCPSLPVEHRSSTTPHHHTLLGTALVIPDLLVPCCFNSVSVSRLQLLQGRPLLLFPCRFQVSA